ncbi:9711_t:CDS:1, partial [Ambispora leptoticha]
NFQMTEISSVSFGKLPKFSETISLSPDLQSEDSDVIYRELSNLPEEI